MDKAKQIFFRIAVVLLVMTLVCIPLVEPSSPEFVILIITAVLNAIFVILGIVFAIVAKRRRK